METKYFSILVVAALLFISVAATAKDLSDGSGKNINSDAERMRVIAHTDREVSEALAKGCNIEREAKTLKALSCSKDAASSLDLQEDVKVFAADSGANLQIGATQVQAAGNTGRGTKIAVLDTGYNYNHPELRSSYLGGWNFVANNNNPMDDNGHGSHVAGIITADGIYLKAKGVAPDAGIISGKVLDASGSGYFSDVVAAIYWAVDNYHPDAISMSLGTSPPYTYRGFCDGVLPDLTTAIKYARDKGIIVVVAAGNSGYSGVSIPGCISYSTTVGAVNNRDKIASFSGRGNSVDITAPGVSIYSTWLGTGYATLSGTSMATPMVAGTVALIKSAHPGYNVTQTETALFKTAKDLGARGWDSTYGWGRINAYKAVSYAP